MSNHLKRLKNKHGDELQKRKILVYTRNNILCGNEFSFPVRLRSYRKLTGTFLTQSISRIDTSNDVVDVYC